MKESYLVEGFESGYRTPDVKGHKMKPKKELQKIYKVARYIFSIFLQTKATIEVLRWNINQTWIKKYKKC